MAKTKTITKVPKGLHTLRQILESACAKEEASLSDLTVLSAALDPYRLDTKERVDVLAIRDWVLRHAPQHAFIERAQGMPKQGASSDFKYGRAVGAIEAVIACCAIPLTIVEPSMWKKFHALRGGDKEISRLRALQLFPTAHELLALKKNHGRAEASLIGLYGLNRIPAQAGIDAGRNPVHDELIMSIRGE